VWNTQALAKMLGAANKNMETLNEETVITQKTRELCQAIVEQPSFQSIRRQIDEFMANDEAKMLYQVLSERGEYLQHKQTQGAQLTNEEIAEFEQQRDAFVNNPVARGFMDAQQQIQQMQESVNKYLTKTFELGRLPGPEDLSSGCGTGCGCH
jgi:cell fate (sporulation/competence/biofilm development) regulator YlbF (YheA/YmcA/DUF963 family)